MVRKVGMGRPSAKKQSESWEDYFEEGEKLLWEGAPADGIRLSGNDIASSVFGLVFFGFIALFVMMDSQMSRIDMGPMFDLVKVAWVLFATWMFAGRVVFDAYKRKNSRYALTNKRALIVRRLLGAKLESYPITRDSEISIVNGKLAAVNFAQKICTHCKARNRITQIGFRYIPDVQKVHALLREIQGADK